MSTVLISGASRGIGLEFARQYAAGGWDVIATARRPDDADKLHQLDVQVFRLDAADPTSIEELAQQLSGRSIDVVIANAGVMGPPNLDLQDWLAVFAANSVGPTLLAHALKTNVAASAERKMIAITSQMGSIGDNGTGGSITYRASKAALNAAWRSLSIDWRAEGITLAMLHPGWVRTDMGGPNAQIEPRDSVSGMRRPIAGLSPDRSGAFLNYDGQELPW
jgi:NAD(P)-dependent dehydrogenase (short-subunit alcohol dehydrogenase family)